MNARIQLESSALVATSTATMLDSRTIEAPRRRGKSLTRRKYQQGYTFQKWRKKSDPWLPDEPAYVQYWRDVPGRDDSVRKVVALGLFPTRTMAERAAAEVLEKLRVNSAQLFIEANSRATFEQQGECWLKSLENRKRDPVEQTTIANRRYALDKWIYPAIGEMFLADVNNLALKNLVDKMADSLSPASIRDYSNIVKAVMASAIDQNGEEKFPRKWNEEFIDAPLVRAQRQPSTTSAGMRELLRRARAHYRVLYALLAGCGPLRAGEALGLEIDKHISEDFRTLSIVQKAKRGEIQPYLKTRNGAREVDLCTELAAMLREFVGERRSGLLFQTSSAIRSKMGCRLSRSEFDWSNCAPLERGGFNIFRRFRLTHLEKSECPEALKHFWVRSRTGARERALREADS